MLFKISMEDFTRQHSEETSEMLALQKIERTLITHGKRCADFSLPNPPWMSTNTQSTSNRHISEIAKSIRLSHSSETILMQVIM